MGSLWFFGFISIILFRIFYAGMKSKELFYKPPGRYDSGPSLSEEKVAIYVFATAATAITWPISLPAIGVFRLGAKLAK